MRGMQKDSLEVLHSSETIMEMIIPKIYSFNWIAHLGQSLIILAEKPTKIYLHHFSMG